MDKIHAKIITPEGIIYSDDVDMIVMPGSEGELGVMARHIPMIVELTSGEVRLYHSKSVTTHKITAGIAHITASEVKIVTSL